MLAPRTEALADVLVHREFKKRTACVAVVVNADPAAHDFLAPLYGHADATAIVERDALRVWDY